VRDVVGEAKRELVAANRILGREGILDAYGHVSVRHLHRRRVGAAPRLAAGATRDDRAWEYLLHRAGLS
jgi:hypothetical protein